MGSGWMKRLLQRYRRNGMRDRSLCRGRILQRIIFWRSRGSICLMYLFPDLDGGRRMNRMRRCSMKKIGRASCRERV